MDLKFKQKQWRPKKSWAEQKPTALFIFQLWCIRIDYFYKLVTLAKFMNENKDQNIKALKTVKEVLTIIITHKLI